MSLYCTVCRHPVPEGINQCPNCCNGFIPQLACADCNRPVQRGSASCFQCRSRQPPAAAEPAPQIQGLQSLIPRPPSFAIQNLPAAPPVLPGLPAHVNVMPVLPERYQVRRHGIVADIRTPAGDIEIMQLMGQTVVILHTLAAKMGEFMSGAKTLEAVSEISLLMGQTVVILHTLASQMNSFVGHMELTRINIRGCRLLASDLQEGVELLLSPADGRDAAASIPGTVAANSDFFRQNIRGCRAQAIELQEEIEVRRGPQGQGGIG